jgi:hypothetical protein
MTNIPVSMVSGAHLVYYCFYLAEQEWAAEMAHLLVCLARATGEWR